MATIHFLNVGHGDCTVIEHNDGHLTVIDVNNGDEMDEGSTNALLEANSRDRAEYIRRWVAWKGGGARARALLTEVGYDIGLTNPIEFLKTNYPHRPIFRYIQTHPDFDHMRGLAALEASGIEILNFWDTPHSRAWDEERDQESDRDDWEAYQRLRAGSSPRVFRLQRGARGKYWNQDDAGNGGNGLHILSPTAELATAHDEDGARNELSYVLEYRTAGRRIIFGGDAGQAAWKSILEHPGLKGLKCDVLKASHHGRDSGYHQEAVKAMSPDYTIVSVGKKPETDASNKYRNYSKCVWSTRWWGDLTLHIDAGGKMKWTASETKYAN